MYPYGLIGNCQASALISKFGSVDWLCLPRPDSEPVFGRLLDPDGGHFSIDLMEADSKRGKQAYLENTNILITEIENDRGDRIRITDFCPRFEQFGRMYRPIALFRKVEPLAGSPSIQVTCKPVQGWSKKLVTPTRGSSHLRYEFAGDDLRLTTNMPLTYLCDAIHFSLKESAYFAVTWGAPVEESLPSVFESFFLKTDAYWRTWVKHCSVPSTFQVETIRSALTLKLHCYEDTGAILAALTTSLPEERGGTRNWDYRYCWLRDAHFSLSAFHNLGHFEEMEGFLKFLLGLAERQEASQGRLAPVYSLSQSLPIPETIHSNWAGFQGSAPVRDHNQAAEHVQNDVYGEMILTLAPIFFDERFLHLRTPEHERLLLRMTRLCETSLGQADAGLWEVRDHWQEHTFTHLMCWAGLERASRIRPQDLSLVEACQKAVQTVERSIFEGILWNGPTDRTADSALALAGILRFPREEALLSTVREIQKQLALGQERPFSSFFYRYRRKDDFGQPQSAFLICSFWVAQALAKQGLKQEANAIMEDALMASNELGLFSEHFEPHKRLQLGNFPQAYSHVGLINAAFAVSPPWSDVL